MHARIVAVSFPSLIRAIKDDKVTQEDLDTGLFFLGVTREHALKPWTPEHCIAPEISNEFRWCYFRPDGTFDGDAAGICHKRITDAIERAKDDGRIAWWRGENGQPDHPDPYQLLSLVLVRNGYPAIPGDDGRGRNGSYCYAGVDDRIIESEANLRVII